MISDLQNENPTTESAVVIDRKENLRNHRAYWIGRRAQDIILSSLALVVLSPVMLVTALAIVIDDPGAGPIFTQTRIGRNGKPFRFYKFRSMYPDAEARLEELLAQNEMNGPVFKMKEDPRITRVGKVIRKSGLDELPQLWNILKGELSIVGPRPERDCFYKEFETYIHGFSNRLKVKPGLTGLAQVNGGYDLKPEEKIVFDMEYIRERSVLMDLGIILKTVGVVVFGRGAK